MPLAATVALALGTAIANSILKSWLREGALTDSLTAIIDVVKDRGNQAIDRRDAETLDRVGQQVAAGLRPLWDAEHLPADARHVVAVELATTLRRAPIDANLLVAHRYRADRMAQALAATRPELSRQLSEAELSAYSRLLLATCEAVLQAADKVANLSSRTDQEILDLLDEMRATLRDIAASAEQQPARDQADALARDLMARAVRFTILPPPADFTGRLDELASLLADLRTGLADRSGAVIHSLRGMGGIGKTALALKVASAAADLFPDGQLYLDLQGQGRPEDAVSPAAALQAFLRPFVPADARLPDDLASLAALYRQALHDQRVLILADNALNAEQVRLLQPPHGCALLVTSRQRFGLPGMTRLDLDTLAPPDAEALLLRICPRIGSHAADLAALCGHLPLALVIAAGLLVDDESRTVEGVLARLRDSHTALAQLRDPDDPTLDVEATLRTSWDALDAPRQWLLAQLGVFPAPFDLPAVEAVAILPGDDIPVPEELLSSLVRRSLVDARDGLYDLHDLVRAFALARLDEMQVTATGQDDDGILVEQDLDLAPLIRWRHALYYFTVCADADTDFRHGGDHIPPALAAFDRAWPQLAAAWDWLKEYPTDEAARLVCDLPGRMPYILFLRLAPRQRLAYLEAALLTARRLGDRPNEGVHLGNLGAAYAQLGDHRRAIYYAEQVLEIKREAGDRCGQGTAFGNLGSAYFSLGDARRALEYHERALAIARECDDHRSEGNALGGLGLCNAAVGEPGRAIELYEQAAIIYREIGDRRGEATTLSNLGTVHAELGDLHQAIKYYEQAQTMNREIGDKQGEGRSLGNLADAYVLLGNTQRAIKYFEQALVIDHEIGDLHSKATHLGNLGLAYAAMGNLDRAIGCYEQHYAIARDIGDRRGEGNALGNLGNAYAALDDSHRAIDCHQEHLAIARDIGDRRGESNALGNLGIIYARFGQVEKAITSYEQQIAISHAIGDRQREAMGNWNLGALLLRQSDFTGAVDRMQILVDYERAIGRADADKHAAIVIDLRRRAAALPDSPAP